MVRQTLFLAALLITVVSAGCGSPPEKEPVGAPARGLPTFGPVVLQFHRQGGIAGLCDDATVHADGVIEYHTCGKPVQTATLTGDERKALAGWVEEFQGFTYKQEDNPGGPDNLVRELRFTSHGSTPATDEQKQTMLAWIERIYGELAQQPQPGSAAATAGRVIEVVNQQIIVIKPDEPGHDLIAVMPETQFRLSNGDEASLADVVPGVQVEVQGIALGAGGLQAEIVIIQRPETD